MSRLLQDGLGGVAPAHRIDRPVLDHVPLHVRDRDLLGSPYSCTPEVDDPPARTYRRAPAIGKHLPERRATKAYLRGMHTRRELQPEAGVVDVRGVNVYMHQRVMRKCVYALRGVNVYVNRWLYTSRPWHIRGCGCAGCECVYAFSNVYMHQRVMRM